MGAAGLVCAASSGATHPVGWGEGVSSLTICAPLLPHIALFLLLPQLCSRVQRQEQRLQAQAASLAADQEEAERLSDWITAAEEALRLRDQEPLPDDARQLEELGCQHTVR